MNEVSREAKKQAVEKALDLLMEHFETAQVTVTTTDDPDGSHDGSTYILSRGRGNCYARVESCREFIREFEKEGHEPLDNEKD